MPRGKANPDNKSNGAAAVEAAPVLSAEDAKAFDNLAEAAGQAGQRLADIKNNAAKPKPGKEETAVFLSLDNPMELKTAYITLDGMTPLLMHKWSNKAMNEILEKQKKMVQGAKQPKDEHQDYWDSMYHYPGDQEFRKPPVYQPGDRFMFPATAFKSACITAISQVRGLTKVLGRQAFHVRGEEFTDWVEIIGEPRMRRDMVRVGMGTADIRFRGEFPDWQAKLKIVYNPDVLPFKHIVNLLTIAGFGVGVGEWRPEREGQLGCFRPGAVLMEKE